MKTKINPSIFWDTDIKNIDLQKHSRYIVEKVVKWGNFNDWQELKKLYSKVKIISEIKQISTLSDKDKNFFHLIYNIPLNQLCTKKQLAKKLSPFYNRSAK